MVGWSVTKWLSDSGEVGKTPHPLWRISGKTRLRASSAAAVAGAGVGRLANYSSSISPSSILQVRTSDSGFRPHRIYMCSALCSRHFRCHVCRS